MLFFTLSIFLTFTPEARIDHYHYHHHRSKIRKDDVTLKGDHFVQFQNDPASSYINDFPFCETVNDMQ